MVLHRDIYGTNLHTLTDIYKYDADNQRNQRHKFLRDNLSQYVMVYFRISEAAREPSASTATRTYIPGASAVVGNPSIV